MEWLIGIGVVAAAIVLLLIAGYVKSPPDTAYIISGFRKPRILSNRLTSPRRSGATSTIIKTSRVLFGENRIRQFG